MRAPAFLVHYAKSGTTALNVITGALGADERTRGVPVIFAPNKEQLADEVRAAAARGQRPVVGWSFYSPDFLPMAKDLAWVRAQTADACALHLSGGVHATAEPLPTLRAGFDRVAIGEGEATAVALFADLLQGGEGLSVRGLGRLDGQGRLVTAGAADRRPLDDFPPFNAEAGKFNAIEITRGCVYACSFCQTPFMFKARFRHRSVENVRAHVGLMRRAGLRYVRFLTPTCLSYGSQDESVQLDAVEALLAAVREEMGSEGKIYFGTFPSELRPEHVSEAALAVLRRYVDNTGLVIGGQSGSERVLREARRGHGVAEIERAVRLCVRAGFEPSVDFLLGLPGEAPEDRALSLQLAQRLVALGARIHGHAFMPLPGTPLRGAEPEPIEPEVSLAMARLESDGALYGQWRKQLRVASELVQLRRGSPPSRGSSR